jgi:cell filamentation protein
MILENKLGIFNQLELAKAEEKISKQKAWQLLVIPVIWTKKSTFQINDYSLFMRGIDVSYYYEGYSAYITEKL